MWLSWFSLNRNWERCNILSQKNELTFFQWEATCEKWSYCSCCSQWWPCWYVLNHLSFSLVHLHGLLTIKNWINVHLSTSCVILITSFIPVLLWHPRKSQISSLSCWPLNFIVLMSGFDETSLNHTDWFSCHRPDVCVLSWRGQSRHQDHQDVLPKDARREYLPSHHRRTARNDAQRQAGLCHFLWLPPLGRFFCDQVLDDVGLFLFQSLVDMAPKYILEQFLEAELLINITEHTVMSSNESFSLNLEWDTALVWFTA